MVWLACMTVVAPILSAAPAPHDPKPTEDQTRAELVRRGLAALEAEQWSAAMESLMDAQAVGGKGHVARAVDKEQAAALEGLAVAYMRLGRYDKAREPLDRIYAAGFKTRDVVLNRVALEIVQKFNIMRGVREAMEYLNNAGDIDEEVLNALGTMLNVAAGDPRLAKSPVFKSAVESYTRSNEKLEAKRPGLKRWGPTWMPAAEATELAIARDAAAANIDRLVKQEQSARVGVERARQILDRKQRLRTIGPPPVYDYEKIDYESALSVHQTAERELAQAKSALTVSPWKEKLEPVLPGARPAIAVATPVPEVTRGLDETTPDSKPQRTIKSRRPPRPVDADPPVPEATDPTPPPTPAPKVIKKVSLTRYAAAFPIAPDLLVTACGPLEDAAVVSIQAAGMLPFDATIERRDSALGLALLRITDKRLAYFSPAERFGGGMIKCASFPAVSIFEPVAESITGGAAAPVPGAPWTVNLQRHPRLAGAPLLDREGNLIGVALPERDSPPGQIPAVSLDKLLEFAGKEMPKNRMPGVNPTTSVMRVTATFQRGG